MRYQLVAIDVDGTLQTSDHRVTPRTEAALRACQARGVHIVLATGKVYAGIAPIVTRLGLASPQITSGGAVITRGGAVIKRRGVPPDLARRVIAMAAELGVTLVVLRDAETFVTAVNRDVEYMLSYGDPYPTVVADLTAVLDPAPTQLYIVPYQQDALYDHVTDLFTRRLGDRLGVRRSSPYFLEFTHPQASKGAALQTVMDDLGVAPERALVIGDSYNDLSMFAVAGKAIAMGQSHPDIQRAAAAVTATNDDDGVAQALERWILGDSWRA